MKRSFLIFATITFLVLLVAWISVMQRTPETEIIREELFPKLADKINDISQIEIKDNEESVILVKKRGQWLLQNQGDYPAKITQIKPLVIAISELLIREAKTSNPDRYSRLHVEDVSEKSKSRQIILKNQKGDEVASLLVGKDRVNRTDGSVDSLYVRKAAEKQSYLVKGQIEVSADPKDWWDNQIIDLSPNRLQSIRIEHSTAPDQMVEADRKNKVTDDYELKGIPEGFKIQSQTTINSLSTVVEAVRFDDVNSSVDFKWPEDITTSTYKTFDGMEIVIKSAEVDGKIWTAFSFLFNQSISQQNTQQDQHNGNDEVSENKGDDTAEKQPLKSVPIDQEVEQLNNKANGWVYVLPEFISKSLRRKKQDLINTTQENDQEKVIEDNQSSSFPLQTESQPMMQKVMPP